MRSLAVCNVICVLALIGAGGYLLQAITLDVTIEAKTATYGIMMFGLPGLIVSIESAIDSFRYRKEIDKLYFCFSMSFFPMFLSLVIAASLIYES